MSDIKMSQIEYSAIFFFLHSSSGNRRAKLAASLHRMNDVVEWLVQGSRLSFHLDY